ncbi:MULTISPECIES: 1,2-phenylacetyl-CoA epoxidase subunit PaaD [Isoptericola]|uniref:Phenylacetate-CoA oxygenase subunit PaaJ n=1 Tax=Isoptericola sediminis TaxID=2733572 RepID=A0A849K8I7_9MICO|nr:MULTISPECIES: 1,2-phenylacetyl-CoA epoxidase subunit PaaD [unclassified Isoptericola]MDO8145403.1 1,2-phenylacetyl-CoA epoxidase subunit PaaD [Isoptericola sp. 178]MDO8149044.1 1,2-phenylacetyl-CoA epoxidase subunit PaaD [Isoptericola sp. b515]MDO8151016.1 1,2-phenylacetyl-CoA epoxidase subunit PaaD [Isoptericola sp. b408]NNU28349.1 phenylacetate-CoA oxygenase subunit PaaJ [Isoptericola sediminis]
MTGTRPHEPAAARVWDIAAEVLDPEVPVLTIEDLGVLRTAEADERGAVRVVLTPTYSGCPAIDQMRDDVRSRLRAAGYEQVVVEYTLAPAWSTDWMSEAGKRKLADYGIAPPDFRAASRRGPVLVQLSVRCPRCGSTRTREVARFGSTSCKALHECLDCLEPFDYFKVH